MKNKSKINKKNEELLLQLNKKIKKKLKAKIIITYRLVLKINKIEFFCILLKMHALNISFFCKFFVKYAQIQIFNT